MQRVEAVCLAPRFKPLLFLSLKQIDGKNKMTSYVNQKQRNKQTEITYIKMWVQCEPLCTLHPPRFN